MSHAPRKVERRRGPRYVVFRDCSIDLKGTRVAVTLLNISKHGLATLGPEMSVAPGDRIKVDIQGLAPGLEIVVVNVSFGRIGAEFDLTPERAAIWTEEFAQLTVGLAPLK